MPIYEYRCRSCTHSFDLKQGFDADPIASCPVCEGEAGRVFGMPAVIYKGSGFYTTDYKRKGESSSESSNGSKTESAAASTSTKED